MNQRVDLFIRLFIKRGKNDSSVNVDVDFYIMFLDEYPNLDN